MKKYPLIVLSIFGLLALSGCLSPDSQADIQKAVDQAIQSRSADPCLQLNWGDNKSACIEQFYKTIDDATICQDLPFGATENCTDYYFVKHTCTTKDKIDLDCIVTHLVQVKRAHYCDLVGEDLRKPCYRKYYQQINDPGSCSLFYEEDLKKECQDYYTLS